MLAWQIEPDSPFLGAFRGSDGWRWVSNVIGAGAGFGILTSLLVAMLGQARYLCVIGRSNVVPGWLARVHPSTATPVNASAFLGTASAPPLTAWPLLPCALRIIGPTNTLKFF